MRVPIKTIYALRAVFDIAYHNDGGATHVRDIARRQAISQRYLEQIFQGLKRAGIVASKRGPRGGYLLAREASRITAAEIFAATAGSQELLRWSRRNRVGSGGEDPVWQWIAGEIEKRLGEVLNGITVEWLCRKGEELGIHRAPEKPFIYFI